MATRACVGPRRRLREIVFPENSAAKENKSLTNEIDLLVGICSSKIKMVPSGTGDVYWIGFGVFIIVDLFLAKVRPPASGG